MENRTKILSIIRSGILESRILILENREKLIEALTMEYDSTLAGMVDQVDDCK